MSPETRQELRARLVAETRLSDLRARLFAATWLSYAGFYFVRKVFGVVKGPLKQALAVDDLGVSHLFTAYLVSYMLGQFAAAWLGRRISSRRMLLGGMAIAAVANVASGAFLSPSGRDYALFLSSMVIQGFAQAVGWSNNVALMTQWTRRRERGRVMAFWGTCYQLGAVGAKAFAAFMFGWLGLRWSFWGASVLLVGIALLFHAWAEESPAACGLPPLDDEPDDVAASEGGPTRVPGAVMRLIVTMGLLYFSYKFLRYALDSWSALVLAEHFKLSVSKAGYLSTAFDWIGFVGVIVGGWWSDRVGARMPVVFGMTVGLAVSTVLLWRFGLGSWPVFVVLLGAVGFFNMGPDSLLSGAGAMDVGTRRQAVVAAALINGLGAIGPIVEEPVIGWIKQTSGVEAVLLLLVAVSAMAALSTGLFWHSLRRRKILL